MVLRKIIGGIFVSIEVRCLDSRNPRFQCPRAISVLMLRITVAPQLYYYRDSLSYLSNLKHATVRLVFAFSQLLSFHLTFDVFFCYGVYEKICNTASYQLVSPCPIHQQLAGIPALNPWSSSGVLLNQWTNRRGQVSQRSVFSARGCSSLRPGWLA